MAQELHEKMADENSSINDIAAIIAKDQALAGQMLKLANSAFFAGLNRVRTIRESIMRLGVNQVYNCLVACSQKEYYLSHDPRHRPLPPWSSGNTRWRPPRVLNGCCAKPDTRNWPTKVFSSGLFHDIGKLLLLRVLETIRAENQDFEISEPFILEILDSMHVEQGYTLMNEWSIPRALLRRGETSSR